MQKRIIVGLSGGVDSSVAAALLKDAGYDVIGVHLNIWVRDKHTPACTDAKDRSDAAKVAAQLGIPFHVLDRKERYRGDVLEYFFQEYERGRTPNPDSRCNNWVKFPSLFEAAEQYNADMVATGHYAISDNGALWKGADPNKDQSYFLFGLEKAWLPKIVFPIGRLKKDEVRMIAEKHGLVTSAKKDSQGLCFLGEIDIRTFLERRIASTPGPIMTENGETIGEHDGVVFYTVGQRRGINVASDEPYYVVDRNLETNILVVAKGADNPALYHCVLIATITNRFGDVLPERALAQIRYRQPDQACTLTESGSTVRVTFDEPQRAITPGQNIVLYDSGGRVLGGGTIDKALS